MTEGRGLRPSGDIGCKPARMPCGNLRGLGLLRPYYRYHQAEINEDALDFGVVRGAGASVYSSALSPVSLKFRESIPYQVRFVLPMDEIPIARPVLRSEVL